MKTSVEPAEGNKVKMVVEVPEGDLVPAIDAAFKKLAKEVRLPGFRPGKVPRKVLESHFGIEYARAEALRDAVPEFYASALSETDIDAIAPPEIEVTGGEVEGDVIFDAVIETRPEITVDGYTDLEVAIPAPVLDQELVESQIDMLRSQSASLEPVERAVADGDVVTIDIETELDGEPLEGMTAEGYSYEVGQGLVVPEIDEHLLGASIGDVLEFSASPPDDGHEHDEDCDHDDDPVLDFKIVVSEIAERVLPELDDDFAKEVSEFDTAEELTAELTRQLTIRQIAESNNALIENVGEALADLSTDEIPEPMISAEVEHRVMDMAVRLRRQGSDLETFLAQSGNDPAEITAQFREQAERSARLDLVLRAIAQAENIELDDGDVDEEIDAMATQMGRDGAEVKVELERGRRMGAVRSDILKRKALEWVRDQVRIVDEDGAEVDRADLELPDEPETSDSPDEPTSPESIDAESVGNSGDGPEAEATGDDT